MKKGCSPYTKEERLDFIESYQESGLCVSQFEKKSGLSYGCISRWMRKFGLSETNVTSKKMSIREKGCVSSTVKSAQERLLEARIKQLEQDLKDEQLRSLAYKTMIEIAEEELGIDISKKAGAKR